MKADHRDPATREVRCPAGILISREAHGSIPVYLRRGAAHRFLRVRGDDQPRRNVAQQPTGLKQLIAIARRNLALCEKCRENFPTLRGQASKFAECLASRMAGRGSG